MSKSRQTTAESAKEMIEEQTPLAEMPETPLLALTPDTSAKTGLIRGSAFVKAPANRSRRD